MSKCACHLEDVVGKAIPIKIHRRPLDRHRLLGYVVGLTKRFLVLQKIDGNTLLLNGYAVLRRKQVRRWRVDASFVGRALELAVRTPSPPESLDLTDWASVLASAQRTHPLLVLECEKRLPGLLFIGRVKRLTNRNVRLAEIDSEARWSRTRYYRFRDITQVGFGDGYSLALAALDAAGRTAEGGTNG